MPDLSGARAKIERAKEHIRDLEPAIAGFLAGNPYKLTPEFYAEHSATAYFLDYIEETPSAILLIVGDAAHNLRTALDHLAYSLVREHSPGISTRHVYFPICETEETYKAESARKVKGMSQASKQAIADLHPYQGGNDSLWGLHVLDIIDKHRLLITTVMLVRQLGIELHPEFMDTFTFNMRGVGLKIKLPADTPVQTAYFPAPKPLFPPKKGALLYRMAGNFEANDHIKFTFDIAFDEPEVFKGKAVLETLHQLADLVAGIVDAFELP